MIEQLISFKTAKLAKEKGFNIFCNYCFMVNTKIIVESKNTIRECFAPTQSLLQKWLREVHNIHINVDFGLQWGYQLIPIGWNGEKFSEEFVDGKNWLSYEEALEEGLIKALNLI